MDLSVIFEEEIRIKIPITKDNETVELEFVFDQPDDVQTLKVLQAIENPEKMSEFAEKYAGLSEDDIVANTMPTADELDTVVRTQEAIYRLMDELIVEAPLYDSTKFKRFYDYYKRLDKRLRRELYGEFMSVAVGTDNDELGKKFEILSRSTTMPLEANE